MDTKAMVQSRRPAQGSHHDLAHPGNRTPVPELVSHVSGPSCSTGFDPGF